MNASSVWTPRHAGKIAEALAERLARGGRSRGGVVAVRRWRHGVADLYTPGARDVSAAYRGPERCVVRDGSTYLLPTVVECEVDHPLADREYLFPFASVVEAPQALLPAALGSSLVVTALTNDAAYRQKLLNSNFVGRLNFGPIPTGQISWDQPHEGNLFDHLYARRAFQAA